MKTFFSYLLCISLTCYSLPINASECFEACESYRDKYCWDLTDENMSRIAAGMVSWGLFMAAFTLVFTGFMPSSPHPSPVTGTPDTGALF